MAIENMSQKIEEAGLATQPENPEPRSLADIGKQVEANIDEFIIRVGITNDPKSITNDDGRRDFPPYGSSEGGYAKVFEYAGALFFRAAASVMELPSDRALILPLMRELLILNGDLPTFGRLGIMGKHVFATITYPVQEMNGADVGRAIHSVFHLADSVDDSLKRKYAKTTKKRC